MKLSERVHPEDRHRHRACDKCGYTGQPDMRLLSTGNVRASCAMCQRDFGFVKLLAPPVPFVSEADRLSDPTRETKLKVETLKVDENASEWREKAEPGWRNWSPGPLWSAFMIGVWAVAITGGLFGAWAASMDGAMWPTIIVVGAGGLFSYWMGRQSVLHPEL